MESGTDHVTSKTENTGLQEGQDLKKSPIMKLNGEYGWLMVRPLEFKFRRDVESRVLCCLSSHIDPQNGKHKKNVMTICST